MKPDLGNDQHRDTVSLPGGIDCVYFLMWVGWKEELRSNRWHYATHWARVAPVVLVQPDLPSGHIGEGISEAEPRIANCHILHIEGHDSESSLRIPNQLAQIEADMRAHGYRRPLLWNYNPKLVGVYCGLPAVARVLHATENHFDFGALPEGFEDQLKLGLRASDLVVAVSSGVARGIAVNVPEAKVITVSNGCDYTAYSTGKPDAELMTLRQGYPKVAIYAGNINLRIHFELIYTCATRYPDTLFALIGPVKGSAGPNPLEPADQEVWNRILQLSNCHYFGPVDPDRLPDFYAAADVGIIPYKNFLMIRENGFALKALEMLASGLPTVSTLMRPLIGICDGLVVVGEEADFVDQLGGLHRYSTSPETHTQMAAVCRANDYGRKFQFVLDVLSEVISPSAAPGCRPNSLLAELRRHLTEVERNRRSGEPEIQRLHAIYGEEGQRRDAEIERLSAEIQHSNAVYGDETQRLTAGHQHLLADNQRLTGENQRLTAENQRLTGENERLSTAQRLRVTPTEKAPEREVASRN